LILLKFRLLSLNSVDIAFSPFFFSMWNDTLQNFADELLDIFRYRKLERRSDVPITALSLDEAYAIQAHNIERRIASGERAVGYKIGCTSRAIREQFGLGDPVSARLMAPYLYEGPASLITSDYVNCAVEPEFVFRIGCDVTAEFIEHRNISESIEYISPGIEVHHYKFWYGAPSFQELISSNAIHACVIVGHEKRGLGNLDLEMERVGLFSGADLVASGIGAEILGGPLKSLAWLAGNLLHRGEYLKEGDLVIPGSPVKLVTVEKGAEITSRFTHFGSVQALFH